MNGNDAALVVLAGLPGVGKTSIAIALARLVGAVFVRIDSIELALHASGQSTETIGAGGYLVGYAIARDNLRSGLTVIADSVNPLPATRDAWQDVATGIGAKVLEVEVVCSDRREHRRRVEERLGRIPEMSGPTWAEVAARDYRPWNRDHVVLDTATLTVEQGAEAIRKELAAIRQ
jgi:predicted kinase